MKMSLVNRPRGCTRSIRGEEGLGSDVMFGLKSYILVTFLDQEICHIIFRTFKEYVYFWGFTHLRGKCLLQSVDQTVIHSNNFSAT